MKLRILLCLLNLLWSISVYAQDIVSYTYDATGNRVERTLVLDESMYNVRQRSSVLTDRISGRIVNIYLEDNCAVVEINSIDGIKSGEIYLSSYPEMKSSLSRKITSTKEFIELKGLPNGIYFLTVKIDSKKIPYKLIKK